jgi:hypothetical protein
MCAATVIRIMLSSQQAWPKGVSKSLLIATRRLSPQDPFLALILFLLSPHDDNPGHFPCYDGPVDPQNTAALPAILQIRNKLQTTKQGSDPLNAGQNDIHNDHITPSHVRRSIILLTHIQIALLSFLPCTSSSQIRQQRIHINHSP